MSTQKALYIPSKQAPMQIGEAPIYTPGPTDLLVKIMAVGLNPVDWKMHTYGILVDKFPAILGTDIAGVVESVGAKVTKFAKGDRVVFLGKIGDNSYAGFQQYTLADSELAAKIPDNVSFDQAGSVSVGVLTVMLPNFNHNAAARTANFVAPWEEGDKSKFVGKPAFIVGGASSVGQYAIQIAKLSGYSPIITTASLHNEALLKSLGATAVLDRKLPASTIIPEVQKLAGGQPVEYVLDAISVADTQLLAYDALAPGGTLIILLDEQIPTAKKQQAGHSKRVVHGWGTAHVPENREIGVELFSRLTEWLRTGVIVPNKVEVLPNGLAGIPYGLEQLKQDKVSGRKLIGRPQETV